MTPISKSCFTTYSTDVPGPTTIRGINGDTEVLGIGTVKLTSPDGGELYLENVLHAPGLPYSLLSIGRLMQSGCTVNFKDLYCTVTNSSGFYIKSKFAPSFGATSYFFRFV